jgi:hypothetical protein
MPHKHRMKRIPIKQVLRIEKGFRMEDLEGKY